MKRTCPECKGPLLLFMSMKLKACADCRTWFKWELNKGQTSLVVHQR